MAQIETFKCQQCGTCCSHIRGMMPNEDKEFMQKMAFDKIAFEKHKKAILTFSEI